MAALRAFRGVRYAETAGPLSSLLSLPTETLDGAARDEYAVRHPHNAVGLAAPEGHADDRSKYIRYARAAARLAEWRREGFLAVEPRPAFYRLTQPIGNEISRTSLFAIADLDSLKSVEATDVRIRDERLRLLEATRTAFEPALAFYDDPSGTILQAVRTAPTANEVAGDMENLSGRFETIDDPDAIEALTAAFRDRTLYVADGAESVEAARLFPGANGAFVALASFDDPAFARLPVHRVLRRIPGGRETLIERLATRFAVEEHHSRNLPIFMEKESEPVFGVSLEGGLGYLLRPLAPIEGPAAAWLQREIFVGLLGLTENEPTLSFVDPRLATRATDEGAAAAFLLPRTQREDLRRGQLLPHRSGATYPPVPTGFVYWSIGDDA